MKQSSSHTNCLRRLAALHRLYFVRHHPELDKMAFQAPRALPKIHKGDSSDPLAAPSRATTLRTCKITPQVREMLGKFQDYLKQLETA